MSHFPDCKTKYNIRLFYNIKQLSKVITFNFKNFFFDKYSNYTFKSNMKLSI